MALSSAYQTFLATVNPSLLASDANLNYLTTLTTFNESAAVVKHLTAQQKVLKKRNEKVISAIESANAVCLDIETTMEFMSGGGAYLPGLDDNFLADHVVTFPVSHIVHFDEAGKIKQIRIQWDQGSLLKMMDVIGSRGRNWPINDGKDQIRLIRSNAAAIEGLTSKLEGTAISGQHRTATRDPHASLNLFAPREEQQRPESGFSSPPAVVPRASARPPTRDLNELFGSDESQAPSLAAVANKSNGNRPASPTKSFADYAPKAGAGKNYQPSRIFSNDENDPPGAGGSPGKQPGRRMPHPSKYNHFDFADGHDEPQATPKAADPSRPKSKHASQWDFADFTTPAKVAPRPRHQNDVRHFALGDDSADAPDNTPAPRAAVAQPRRDAETHFEFRDDGESGQPRKAGPGLGHTGHARGLSSDLFEERSSAAGSNSRPDTATSLKDRQKDFDPHFAMADDSPAAGGLGERTQSQLNRGGNAAYVQDPRPKANAARSMNAQWDSTEGSPLAAGKAGKENMGIKTGGDGMGARKGKGRGWGIGDESAGEEDIDTRATIGGRRKGGGSTKSDGWNF